jgi:hypothetical protein
MRRFTLSLITALFLVLPLAAWGAPLDDYYLARYQELYATKVTPSGLVATRQELMERSPTMFLLGVKKDWNRLESTTRAILAGAVSGPPALSGEQTFVSTGGHFKVHYATTGIDAPSSLVDANGNGFPDWVETVGSVLEFVYGVETGSGSFGYQAAPTTATNPYDVYLKELASTRQFGYTETTSQAGPNSFSYTSFMVFDKDFQSTVYGRYGGISGLQITAAHEYHHAIQFGYNIFFESWYAEATSTWIEDEVYDSINQLYSYAVPYLQNTLQSIDAAVDVNTGGGYGRWLFNRYLAERLGIGIIKGVWQRLATTTPPKDSQGNLLDIAMTPLINTVLAGSSSSLQEQFTGFARRIYLRDWASHTNEIPLIGAVAPIASYSTFPVNSSSLPISAVSMPAYSFAYFKFTPSSSAPATLLLTTSRSQGVALTAFHKGISGTITEYPLDAASNTITIPGFNSANTQEVVLLAVNPTATANLAAGFTTDGSTPPTASPSSSTPTPTPTPTTTQTTSSSSGGGGCFIATAAYGSYLHPKVRILRDFRDRHLLTSGPGRVLVACYYRISPPIAAVIADREWLRGAFRLGLTPVVFIVENPMLGGGCGVLIVSVLGMVLWWRITCIRQLRVVFVRVKALFL